MAVFPPLTYANSPHSSEERAARDRAEQRRAWIYNNFGPEQLAISDQYVRAMVELGVTGAEQSASVARKIESALAAFMFRGAAPGTMRSGSELLRSVDRIAVALESLAKELGIIMAARRSLGLAATCRAENLDQIHRAILDSIVEAVADGQQTIFPCDQVAGTMPTVGPGLHDFSDSWTPSFNRAARKVRKVRSAFEVDDLNLPTHQAEQSLTDFIHRLGSIYKEVTGRPPAANKRKATQPDDWNSPFVRFLQQVWPLTPEGSNGGAPPSVNKIASALKSPPTFTPP